MKRPLSVLMILVMIALILPFGALGADAETLPTAVDLSTTIHLPPIANQNNLGSCVSMAVTHMQFTNAYSRYIHSVDPNVTWDPSSGNAHYVFAPRYTFNMAGANTAPAYQSLIEQGTMPQTLCSFSGGVTGAIQAGQDVTYDWATQDNYVVDGVSYHIWEEAQKYRIKNYDQVWLNGEDFGGRDQFSITTSAAGQALIERIKSQLNAGNVVVTGGYPNTWTNETPVTISQRGTYGKSGEKAIAYSTGVQNGGHQVAIVGYDDNITCVKNGVTLRGAFKVANSWGTGWMNDGFIWMMYDALNGKDQSAYSALNTSNRTWTMDQMVFMDWRYDLNIGAPSVQASVKISSTKTDACRIELIRIDATTGETATCLPFIMSIGHPTKWDDGVVRNFYGHVSSDPVEGELSFNFDQLIASIPAGKTVDDYLWGLKLSSPGGLTSTVRKVRLLKNGVLQYEASDINETVDATGSRIYTLDSEKTLISTDLPGGVTMTTASGSPFALKNVPFDFSLSIATGYKKTKAMSVYVNGERLIDEGGVYTFVPSNSALVRVTGVVPTSPRTIPINSYNGTNNFEKYGNEFVYIIDVANRYVDAAMYESGINVRYSIRIGVGDTTYEFTPSSLYRFENSTLYRIPVADQGWFPDFGVTYYLNITICRDGVPLYNDSSVAAYVNYQPFSSAWTAQHTHTYSSARRVIEEESTCTYKGKAYRFCSSDGCCAILAEELPLDATKHPFSGSELTKNATSTAPGEYSYVCPDCGASLLARTFTAPKCDVTGDNEITIDDVSLLLDYLARRTSYESLACGGDFTGDGICSIKDLTYLLLVTAGRITP